jgi:exodeoxyribonuclease VII large subunit
MIDNDNILSISQLTKLIQNDLESNFADIAVEGEISNFKQHSSGHKYFSLKDNDAQISAVMWKGQRLNFIPEDGQKVVAFGRITVYAPRGSYQMQVNMMTPQGVGDLFLKLEQLKEKLKEKGYFDSERKREIPKFPEIIGVSTSQTGAAVRDIISTIRRRYPIAKIYLRPTVVQGNDASPDIVNAIKELNNLKCDVIIIGRGGGSIEDLWAYNTEEVANTIFKSKSPIISAVGHETDFTISDFVADLRAATPTAAGELATPFKVDDLINHFTQNQEKIRDILYEKIDDYQMILNDFEKDRTKNLIMSKINLFQQKVDYAQESISKLTFNKIKDLKYKLNNFESELKSINPELPLKRGYAILKKNNKYIKSTDVLNTDDKIEIIRENNTNKALILNDLQDTLF